MPRKIDESACIACGSCQGECPVDAIIEGPVYTIEADKCIDCAACESQCPVGAITEE
ncbi:MAG: 4Fe-4S binding protein [Peptoniphilus sp.]|nr:4Fe-4S binding protein [Peptoniphilus sp.]